MNNDDDFSIKQFFKEVADNARQTFGVVREEFRAVVDTGPTTRKLALKFHRATMTDKQRAAYEAIKKTKNIYVDKRRSVPAYTVDAELDAADAAKALRVLELEQPDGQDGILVKWKCKDAVATTTKMRRKWF